MIDLRKPLEELDTGTTFSPGDGDPSAVVPTANAAEPNQNFNDAEFEQDQGDTPGFEAPAATKPAEIDTQMDGVSAPAANPGPPPDVESQVPVDAPVDATPTPAPPVSGMTPGQFGLKDPMIAAYLKQQEGAKVKMANAEAEYRRSQLPLAFASALSSFGTGFAGHHGASDAYFANLRNAKRDMTVGAAKNAIDLEDTQTRRMLELARNSRLDEQQSRLLAAQEAKDRATGVKAQRDAEANDPNSDISQRTYKANVERLTKLGLKDMASSIAGLTAAQQEKFVPQAIQEALAAQQEKGRNDRASLDRAARMSIERQKEAHKDDSKQDWSSGQVSTTQQKMAEVLTAYKSRGAMADARKGINLGEHALSLIDQIEKQPGSADSRQYEELATITAKLLQNGGQPVRAQIEALKPHTAAGKYASVMEYITNAPHDAEYGQFVKRLKDTIVRQKGVSQKQLERFRAEALGGFERFREDRPHDYDATLNRILDADREDSGGLTPDEAKRREELRKKAGR